MRILYAFILPLFLITAGACKKPVLEVTDGTIPPLVLTTSIEDSMPTKTIKALRLDGLTGLKIQHYSGLYTTYFEYEADKNVLLKAISELPFPMNAVLSDTGCREIPLHALDIIRKSISSVEIESAPGFWSKGPSHLEIFECIKPPFRHILQIDDDKHVSHRIELLGQS